MKQYFLMVAIVLFAFSTSYAQPKLKVEGGDNYNWGTVKPKDSPLKADIILKNDGDELLKITKVKPTCGCTTAPLDKYELKPGESAKMHVTLNIGRRSGKVHKSIRVYTNESSDKHVIGLLANVIREIEVGPRSYITFDQMTVGIEKTAKLWIKNNSKQIVKLSDIETKPEGLEINLKKDVTIQPGDRVELVAKAKPSKPGYFNCSIMMKTDHPDFPTLKIQGLGRVEESPLFNSEK